MKCRNLVLILGDQLDLHGAALQGVDPAQDIVFMAEVPQESTVVWSHKARIALFLSAMRHFAEELKRRGIFCDYAQLGEHTFPTLKDALTDAIRCRAPDKIIVAEPGEYRIEQMLREVASSIGVGLEVRDDTHFLISRREFAGWASAHPEPRMEQFYRHMRKRSGILMEGAQPRGGKWNYDGENREHFGKEGPGQLPAPPVFPPDTVTRKVIAEVERRFGAHPGDLATFAWPVTRTDALAALKLFIKQRLPDFGRYQDAMWTGEPWLYHSLVSTALNLKLLNPREVIAAAVAALHEGRAPLAAVEGFVRQILGWREFVRGMYWLDMPAMREANHFGHSRRLPAWYWTGNTQMNCMRQAIGQTLKHGYAHHIQRLMITGQFALLAEVAPREVEDWYLAVYVDAVEWVELPNVAGMALYANGGRFTSKPYIASGAYIDRMSNYCSGCRYRPEEKAGSRACPVTTLYWHFLDKHADQLAQNPRTALMAASVAKLKGEARAAMREQAALTLSRLDSL
jgi:deoxyribodipyrimidine photolyase-related protein